MTQKKTLYIVTGVVGLLVAGVVLYLAFRPETPETTRMTNSSVQKDANLDREGDRPVMQEPNAKPSPANASPAQSCENVNASIIQKMLGDGYTVKNTQGGAKLPSDLEVCEYTKDNKRATIVVHEYGVERAAEIGKKSIADENTVVARQGSVVVAVSYWQGGSYQKDPAQKALDEIIKSIQ